MAAALAAMSTAGDHSAELQQLVQEQFGRDSSAPSSMPVPLQHVVERCTAGSKVLMTAASSIVTKAAAGIQQLKAAVTQLPPDAGAGVTQLTGQLINLRSDLMATWAAAGGARPLPELVDVADGLLSGPLNDFGTKYQALINALAPDATAAVADYANQLDKLKNQINALAAIATSDLDKLAALLKLNYSSTVSGPLTYLDYFRYDLTFVDTDRTKTWAGGVYDKLTKAAASGAAAVANVQKEFNDAVSDFNDKLTKLQTAITGEISNLGQGVTDAINGIKAEAANTLANLQSELNKALQNLPDPTTPQQLADIQKAVLQFPDASNSPKRTSTPMDTWGCFCSVTANVGIRPLQTSCFRWFVRLAMPVCKHAEFPAGQNRLPPAAAADRWIFSPVTSISRHQCLRTS